MGLTAIDESAPGRPRPERRHDDGNLVVGWFFVLLVMSRPERAMNTQRVWIASLFLSGLVCALASSQAPSAPPRPPALLKASFAKLPIYFVENRGVYPDEVAYYVKGRDKTLFFGRDGITFLLRGPESGWAVKLVFVDASPAVVIRGEDRQTAVFSYFRGPEKDWKTGLPTFSRVVYENLWPGIDLVYRGERNHLKYEFHVEPGADPGRIRLRYIGATNVTATPSGSLRIETPSRVLEDDPPVAYQDSEGGRMPVDTRYMVSGGGDDLSPPTVTFSIGPYDQNRPLILDPAYLVYCGYIGGDGLDWGNAIAVDTSGNAYVTGVVASFHFPVRVGPYLIEFGATDVFVAKVNAAGTGLIYSGFLGGSRFEDGRAIAVDAGGNAYVAGNTESQDFPTKVGPSLTYHGGPPQYEHDAFVAKVNASGTQLVYSGFIGGSKSDVAYGIAVDSSGSAYVAGSTESDESTFPVRIGPDTTYNGVMDAFVAKILPNGSSFIYCGYIGGSDIDSLRSIAVDGSGNAYVAGHTDSTVARGFPAKVGPDLSFNGYVDGFVAKLNSSGSTILYCGYLGGTGQDYTQGIAVDAQGNAYVTGYTTSDETTFPVNVGPCLSYKSPYDAFLAKVDASGSFLIYCGYVGGKSGDQSFSIAVDSSNNAYIAGTTLSSETSFPVTGGPSLKYLGYSNSSNLGGDAFVAKVNADGTRLLYCGYIGGKEDEMASGIAVDPSGNAFVVGTTCSDETSFPVKVGPYLKSAKPQDQEVFVARIADVTLDGPSSIRPGSSAPLLLSAPCEVGLVYQIGSSLGTGPIVLGNHQIHLSPDDLLHVSVSGLLPTVFRGYSGVVPSSGHATASIAVPNIPALSGITIHTAFVTLNPSAPWGINTVSNTRSLIIIP